MSSCLFYQYVIRAPEAGKIVSVPYKVGDTVPKGAALVVFEHEEDSETSSGDNGN